MIFKIDNKAEIKPEPASTPKIGAKLPLIAPKILLTTGFLFSSIIYGNSIIVFQDYVLLGIISFDADIGTIYMIFYSLLISVE